MRRPDLVAIQDKHILVRRRRGMGDELDIDAAIKKTLADTIKNTVANYKENYVSLATAKSKRDLYNFQSQNLVNQRAALRSSLIANQKSTKLFDTLSANYSPGGTYGSLEKGYWNAQGSYLTDGSSMARVPTMIKSIQNSSDFESFVVNGSTTYYLGLSIANNFNANDFQTILDNKNQIIDYLQSAYDISKVLVQVNKEIVVRTGSLKPLDTALKNALDSAKVYFSNLPSLAEIQARLDRGENPIPELDPPPVVEPIPVPEVIATPVVVEAVKKSKLPWIIGAGVAAIAVLGGSK